MDYQEFITEKLKSRIYNDLAQIAFEYSDAYPDIDPETLANAFDHSIDWFMVHFFKEGGMSDGI